MLLIPFILNVPRRQTLVHLGEASGIFKAFLVYMGGIPQCLFDFLKTVNADNGPMEEYRVTYGPFQYWITKALNKFNVSTNLLPILTGQKFYCIFCME